LKPLLKSLYPYLFLFFCFVIPLDKYATAVPNIVLIALLVSFPFVVKRDDFLKLLKNEVYLFIGLLVFLVINMVLFQSVEEELNIVKKIASSLLLLVLFIPLEVTENLKKTLIFSVLACIFISLFGLYGYYMQANEFNFATGSTVNEVLIIDRLYLGFLCVLSIIVSIGLIGEKYNDYNKWYFANIVLNILFVLLISSRIAILLLLILFFLKIFYSKNKKQYILFFAGILLIVIAAFTFNKNLGERFFYSESSKNNPRSYIELFKTWEPRVVIWECNYNILINDTPLLIGNGFYETKDKLVQCYDDVIVNNEDKRIYFIGERFNPHNQYFDFLISYGIIAFALFLAIFVLLFFRHRNSYYKMALVLSMGAFAFIESFFHRQIGGYIFAIALILILFPKVKETLKTRELKEDEA